MTIAEKIRAAHTAHGVPPEDYSLPFASFAELLDTRERDSGEKIYVTYYDENSARAEWTYSQCIKQARRFAAYFLAEGLRAGDRIATASHNHPDVIALYYGAWLADLCVAPLNMTEDDERLRYILANSGAKLLICREEYAARLSALAPAGMRVTLVFDDVESEDGIHYLSRQTSPYRPKLSPQEARLRLAAERFVVYTSGTTGAPKGVALVERNILADSDAIARWHGINAETSMMCVLPLHHVNGVIVTHTTPFLAGASTTLNKKFQSDAFFARVEREGVHIVSVVPTLLAFLLEYHKRVPQSVPPTLKYLICGAGPLTCALADEFETTFGVRVLHGYGLSETTCYSCFLPVDLSPDEHRRWMQDYGFPSIGCPLPPNEMAIHDERGNALPPGERGEIVARGANVMKEYDRNPEANASAFANGWFRTGDEGFFLQGADGRPYFFITGRLKELIIRGGVNLAPLEIDEILARAPGVKAGIAVGFENDFYGEEVGALVIPDSPEVSKEAILEYCRAATSFSKCPKVVVFTDTLPVTSTGKYQRNRVKHYFAEWKSAQFRK
jgi:long-chain acyl-CoA synthetase